MSVLENAETLSILSIAYDKIIENLTSPDVVKNFDIKAVNHTAISLGSPVIT